MNLIEEQHHKDNIQKALKLYRCIKWIKLTLASAIAFAYFIEFQWFNELIIVSVLLSLTLPLGFFDVFIQKLLEYDTRLLEERQLLNAEEANKHFEKAFSKIERISRDE